METAKLLLSPGFPPALRAFLDQGLSFAAARQRALERLGGDGRLVSSPNNILAVEYCKSILRQGSALAPMPVLRQGEYHATAPDGENPSAAALRQADDFFPFVPAETWDCYAGQAQYRRIYGERAMLARLRGLSEEEFSHVPFGSEGLWRKVFRVCRAGGSVEEILLAAKSKRYPYTRLSRLLLCAYLGISEAQLLVRAPYVRVLGFREAGRALLRRARDGGSVTLCSAGARGSDRAYAALEDRCRLLYALFCGQDRQQRTEKQVFYLEKQEKGLAKRS